MNQQLANIVEMVRVGNISGATQSYKFLSGLPDTEVESAILSMQNIYQEKRYVRRKNSAGNPALASVHWAGRIPPRGFTENGNRETGHLFDEPEGW
jgi:hypothetical protein